jgi:hypothetical protein
MRTTLSGPSHEACYPKNIVQSKCVGRSVSHHPGGPAIQAGMTWCTVKLFIQSTLTDSGEYVNCKLKPVNIRFRKQRIRDLQPAAGSCKGSMNGHNLAGGVGPRLFPHGIITLQQVME